MKLRMMILAAVLPAVTLPVQARTKLAALPNREATVIRLDNPHFTLIEEQRVLTLQRGINQVDFSWTGVSIDPDSIRLTLLDHPDRVRLLNVSYPPDESALVWEIAADGDFAETVRISYLLSHIDRLVTYKAVANNEETRLDLRSFLVLRNFSGEDFQNARIVLGSGQAFEQDMAHEETKQILFLKAPDVPVTKVWTWDSAKLPWDPEQLEMQNVGIPVAYRIVNDEKSDLGGLALWDGKVRLFQDDGYGSTIFLGEDRTAIVPIGEKTELYIGDSRDIVVTQRKMQDRWINIQRNKKEQVVLYDTEEVIRAKIENFKDSPAVLTMIQHIPGQWEMQRCNLAYEKKDASTLAFEITLPARRGDQPAVAELEMHYNRRNVRP